MFARWSFNSPNRHGESLSQQRDGRKQRPGLSDPSRERRKIRLLDIDADVTDRDPIIIPIKDDSRLEHVAESLKKRYGSADRLIPEDAKVSFFWEDKRLDEGDIPEATSELRYRVLKAGDDGSIRVIWQGKHLKLRRSQIEAIAHEVAAGKSVGDIREITAKFLQISNETRIQLVTNANQIIIKAAGGLRAGPLQGNNWEARKVQSWLCRFLVLDIAPVEDFFVLRGFNEQYIWHSPRFADIYRIKSWLKDQVLASVYLRKPRRRSNGIDINDIRLIYRGRPVRRGTRIRRGGTIDFEVPRVVEERFTRAEAWLLPLLETCIVCSDEKRVSEMPNKKRITAVCEHDSGMCKQCVAQWIASSLETTTWDRLKCPECPRRLRFEDVRSFAEKDVFERYDALAVRALLSSIPEFVWCLNPRCNYGQIHPTDCARAKCYACKHALCVRHNVPWHRGETCNVYEQRSQRQKKNNEASEKHIREIAKPCPGCKKNVHKYSGCDHVTCICGHEWCWLCFGQYYHDHNAFLQCHHTPECRYYANPPNYEGGRAFMPFWNPPRPPQQQHLPVIPPPGMRQDNARFAQDLRNQALQREAQMRAINPNIDLARFRRANLLT